MDNNVNNNNNNAVNNSVTNTNENKKNNKKNNVLIIIIVILVFLVVGLGCYFLIDKGIINVGNNDEVVVKEKEDKPEIKEEILTLDDSRFINIYKKLASYTYRNNRESGYRSFTGRELSVIALSDLSLGDLNQNSVKDEFGNYTFSLKGDILPGKLKVYFGDKITFDKASAVNYGATTTINPNGYGSGVTVTKYDSAIDTYTVRFSGLGGTSGPAPTITERKITSAILKGEEITVVEKAIYYSNSTSGSKITYNIFGDAAMTQTIDTKTFDANTIANETISIDSYLDKATTITYKFKLNKNTNTYYFASSSMK